MNRAYTVSQVNNYIRGLIDDDLILQSITVKGELSNVKYHSSGHIYFSLKDAASSLLCVMFAADAYALNFRLENGLQVQADGSIGVYERDGKYQLYVKKVKLEGSGALYEEYEKLRHELLEMGLFDPMYKRPIPRYAKTIGVVTAPTGAAIRDIINIAKRRNHYIKIVLYPAKVQGEGAKESICQGIRALNVHGGIDTIIIGRGGGSIEDLWAFNERCVAEAIFDSDIPIISGTGHETDTTIADWVADLRAPTPSAAAELAVFDYEQFCDDLNGYETDLRDFMLDYIEALRGRLREQELKVKSFSPNNRLINMKDRLLNLKGTMNRLMKHRVVLLRNREQALEESIRKSMRIKLRDSRFRLMSIEGKLSSLSPDGLMARGFSFTESVDGRAIRSIHDISKDDLVNIYLRDGKINAEVKEIIGK